MIEPRFVDRTIKLGLDDAQVPWFILPQLQYEAGSLESRVRYSVQRGMRPAQEWLRTVSYYDIWQTIVEDAYNLVGSDPEEWPAEIERRRRVQSREMREAALQSPRAFTDICEIKDDEGERVVLKDFHVRSILHMRQTQFVCLLLPYMHGKSWLSSLLVPLMDWAEDPETTQIRIYAAEDFQHSYARGLMHAVESNDALHEMFPMVDKPGRGDPAYKNWGVEQFSIRGKTIALHKPSFLPLTWKSRRTGKRADRVGADDWVNDGNADSMVEQPEMIKYFKSGVMTMPELRVKKSRYGTKWGTAFLVGTIFHKQDINNVIAKEWKGIKGRKVIKVDVFPRRDSEDKQEVIWPERRPYDFVMMMKDALGDRAFNMRMRNRPQGEDGTEGFPEADVLAAVSEDYTYGEAPPGLPLIIGFDPATSKRTRYTKYPAIVLLAIGPDRVHWVAWDRLQGKSFPDQINTMILWANIHHCPIAVEDNQTQTSYGEQIRVQAPNVRIFSHTTTKNKRDPISGVEQFIPYFKNENAVIHGRNASKEQINNLTHEFIDWPQSKFTDLVMASWIAKRQYDLRMKGAQQMAQNAAPSFIQGRGMVNYIDIRHLKYGNQQ